MKKIVVTGPESTGKTTLCKHLANHFNTTFVKEYAVDYLTGTGGDYQYKDLLKIAKGQINLENQIIEMTNPDILICDTDLITIKIWSQVKYKKVNRWIMKEIRNRHYNHYLLCFPDIPWEYDLFRENPNDRDFLFELYEKQLKRYKKDYTIINGNEESRFLTAVDVINSVI